MKTALFELCERTSNSIWAEPLNGLTSFGFFLVAFMLYQLYKKHPMLKEGRYWDIRLMIGLVGVLGVGSTLFHALSSRWAEIMDIVPIVSFIVVFFFSALVRVLKCNWLQVATGFIAFLGLTNMLVSYFPGAMNDSIAYLSAMTALVTIALYLNMARRPSARMFLLAAVLGCVSLFFRSIDMYVCEQIPLGTHFLWHVCNSVIIYILVHQIIRNAVRKPPVLEEISPDDDEPLKYA
jgi:drug/metabolite transporter (DMT)-like permease